jgi:hypothetical protein
MSEFVEDLKVESGNQLPTDLYPGKNIRDIQAQLPEYVDYPNSDLFGPDKELPEMYEFIVRY